MTASSGEATGQVAGELAIASPAFGVGAVLELAEADQINGVGVLAIRLTRADTDPQNYRRMEWVNVVGQELHPDGSSATDSRWVTVRVSAISHSLRPGTWVPPRYPCPSPPTRR